MINNETAGVRILVVEDEAIVALGIQGWLKRAGYSVPVVVTSGEEAVRSVVEFQPDLVLMDIRLPGALDGVAAAEQIRARFDIPIIYLTAHTDETTLQRAKLTAPSGYVVKPVEMRELRTAIEMALYKHQLSQQLKESEARYRTITELTSDYAYSMKPGAEGRWVIEWVTHAYSRITGFTLEETEARGGWPSLIHPEDRSSYYRSLEALHAGQRRVDEYRIIAREQDIHWLRVHSIPVLNEVSKRLARIYGAVEEITTRKQAEEALQQRNRELELLNQAGQAFNSSLDLDQVLANLLEEVRPLLGVDGASVWLVDAQTKELVCRQASGAKGEQIRGWRLPPGEGIVGWVVQHGQNLIVPDAQADTRHTRTIDEQTGLSLRSMLNVPLRAREKIIGVLQVVDTEANRFNSSVELRLVESLATTAAIAIENARLYEQTRRDAETMAMLLREVNHRVSNNLAAIIGLLSLERSSIEPEHQVVYETIRRKLVSRVSGLATVHNLLSASGWTALYLCDLARQVASSVFQALPDYQPASVTVSPAMVRVNPDQAHHLALILNELATNAVKHACPNPSDQLEIQISITQKADMVQLEFRDNGPGYPEAVLKLDQHGVGFELIQNLVRQNLRGTLELHNSKGAVSVICFKADAGT